MDVFNQYDIFKEKCFGFSSKFENTCFDNAKFICHPTVENEIISMCSEEEARSNGLNICRLSDMLLMSEDNESWKSFNLMEARSIAERNGFVFLTDLLLEDAFRAEDWMINGKNDTIVVSEAYMREKGKRYAPVTPLTNQVLHFKKIQSPFFWSKSENGEINIIDNKYIKKRLDSYFDRCVENVPSFVNNSDLSFPLFDGNIVIDTNTSCILKIDVFFDQINEIKQKLESIAEILKISDYDFSVSEFLTEVSVSVLNNNGISVSKDSFTGKYKEFCSASDEERGKLLDTVSFKCGDDDIDMIKAVFADILKNSGAVDFSRSSAGELSYESQMRQLEQKDFDGITGSGEEKYLISSILSHKPADYVIFAYVLKRYPEEKENLKNIAGFWGIEPMSDKDLQSHIFSLYLNDELFDENGSFVSGLEQAEIIRQQLEKVNKKYNFEDTSYMNELNEYIKDIDLKRRTYNGTVFDSPEDMKRAMANELELQALCVNLSALDRSELTDLQKHINGVTADETTRAKYLVKVKVAMNRCEESMLEQLCLGLPMMDADETIRLCDEVKNSGYAESVVKPKLADINDHLGTALREELDGIIARLDGMTAEETAEVVKSLDSGRYPAVLRDAYLLKIDEFTDNKIKSEIEKICEGMETFDINRLNEARDKLTDSGYPEKYTYSAVAQLDSLIADYEKNEVAALFENIDFATKEELESIKEKIADKNYQPEFIAPYNEKIIQREHEILNEELDVLCSGIEDMNQEQLEGLKTAVNNPEKGYNEELKAKYFEKIERRECELKNSELAELCKYIFSMEQDKLDELKAVLLSGKYDESLTTVYLKKVTEREDELRRDELDRMCESIEDMDEEQLKKLKNLISSNDDYIAISDEYFRRIDECLEHIKTAEFNRLLETVESMDDEGLTGFRNNIESKYGNGEITEEFYKRGVEKADARSEALELEKLDAVIADIDSFDLEQIEAAINKINSGDYKDSNKETYIEKLNEKTEQLYIAELDAVTADIDNLDKEHLISVREKVQNSKCPAEIKASYIYSIDKHIEGLAEKEIREICGNVGSLSAKKSLEVIIRIRTMDIDEQIKNQYLDSIESHIMAIRNNEQRNYIMFLKQKIEEFNVSTVNFLVPSVSNLFYPKYEEICKTYVSPGRYELPIFLHDNSSDNGFTLTTEYFYFITKGVFNRIKIDDLVSFQAKKTLMSTAIVVTERNGNTSEIACSINKNSIEATAKAMTALINYIRDQRSAEHMKELLENAVKERTAEIEIPVQEAVPETAPAQEKTETADESVEAEAAEVSQNSADTPEASEEADEKKPEAENNSDKAEQENSVEDEKEEASEEEAEKEAPAEEEPKEEAPKIRFCDQCGARIISPTAKFCAECGNKLF